MATMNISLPDSLKDQIDATIEKRGYGTSSEYIRDLVRRDLEVERMRALIQEGLDSPVEGEFDKAYFDDLRRRIRERATR